MDRYPVNPEIWTKVRGIKQEKEYLKDCLSENICPECGDKLQAGKCQCGFPKEHTPPISKSTADKK